ncbi:Cas10/Cmr2 second palm domain-containing protein [Cylindrospermopsis raciborskii]|uniref:Cas10/Cmr2 second palm domain-containing protein n=1 Tax=Cylindrospermopsis raciborskii TaxID=77022 RepID=UPI000B5DFD0F|nr:type III-B CRISPR-associated protein Cas10/Cmr2 [Cylindrospermopsis raciborskii]MEB3145987.1 type III-B CRISPR-associated protein Cas10/Cmr2 [Cylindrospermopsis raciborskii]BAZ88916.1 hypothetical protein NIES932_03830 [Raphidiopsis curvata NIES-932]
MDDEEKYIYTAVTFAPVQGFIEKSRKLRDLYGASALLSYMSQKIIDGAKKLDMHVISPAGFNVGQGTPNRILIRGNFSEKEAREVFLSGWKEVIYQCKQWLDDNLRHVGPYYWDQEWNHWANHSWEIFWAQGDSPTSVMQELETSKLARNWIGINWIGESSSLTGADGIAFPGMGGTKRNPANIDYAREKEQIENFYTELAEITGSATTLEIQGEFIDPSEKLSIPELTKRLVTLPNIARKIDKFPVVEGFQKIQRGHDLEIDESGQWTGWFMGDGDEVGKHLQKIAGSKGDLGLEEFSHAMQKWGDNFQKKFGDDTPGVQGRVIYAGGDDFLGVIYSTNPKKPILLFTAYEWLTNLNNRWQEHEQPITLSVGFVWSAGGVPQRDVLQHCRKTQKIAKSNGRNRVTIRVLFNSGQYVQWTCPWNYLYVIKNYRDRDGKTYSEWESTGRNDHFKPNWNHIFSDLAQLKARHAIELHSDSYTSKYLAIKLFNIYFENGEKLLEIMDIDNTTKWINDLINVGWHICTSI